MLYDAYKNKILKLVAIKNFIKKFRVAIICGLVAILALISTMLAFKGTFTSDFVAPETLVYGDRINSGASAFMARVSYEYKAEGSTVWSGDYPSKVGKYEVRAVASKIFGGKSVSEAYVVEITPRSLEISIKENSIVYGESPTVNCPLPDGDELLNGSLKVEIGEIEGMNQTFTPNASEIVISNSKGIVVTENYVISTQSKTLTITPRAISVTVKNAVSKTYDGKPISCDEYSISSGSLVSGDEISAVFSASLTNVGEVENKPTLSFSSASGEDRTRFYSANVISGYLKVEKRAITVSSKSLTGVYSAMPLTMENAEITVGSLADNQSIRFGSFASITECSSVENAFIATVFDEQNSETTSNYQITYDFGSISITQKPITVQICSKDNVYNGAPFKYSVFIITEGELCGDQSANAIESTQTSLTNVGEAENSFEIAIDENGNVKTQNYSITYLKGTLTVTKRPVDVKPSDSQKIYDGSALRSTEWDDVSVVYGILTNHSLTIQTDGSQTDVGTSENGITAETVLDENGLDVTANYSFNCGKGNLTVVKRPITVRPKSISSIYDGNALTGDEVEIVSELKPVLDHHVEIQTNGEQTEVGSSNNGISSCVVLNGSHVDVTRNYEITYANGTLTVEPRPITIETGSSYKIYDDTPLTCLDFEIVGEYGLVSGHVASIVEGTVASRTEYGESINSFQIEIKQNGTTKTQNYDISYETGVLAVDKRQMTITTDTATKMYDGTALLKPTYQIESGNGLCAGHELKITSSAQQLNVGTVDNALYFEIYKNNVEKTSNYELEVNYGSLSVTKRPLEFTTDSSEKTYDGTSLTCKTFTLTGEYAVVSGQTVRVKDGTEAQITYFGTTENTFEISVYQGLSETTNNYEISRVCGTLSISKRNLTIKPKNAQKEFDGTPLTGSACEAISGTSFANGDVCTAQTNGSQMEVGSSENAITSTLIMNGSGVDVTYNYVIITESGTLTVVVRTITIKPVDAEKTFDGESLTSNVAEIVSANGLVSGHSVQITTNGSQLIVGSSVNNITAWEIIDAFGADASANYNVILNSGVLEVVARPITVETGSDFKAYDGTPLTCADFNVTSELGLVSGHVAEAVSSTLTQITNAGNVENSFRIEISYNGESQTPNYDITYEYGNLEIFGNEITITTGSAEREYDGTKLSQSSFEITVGELAEGHVISILSQTAESEFGTYENVITFDIKHNGTSVFGNYLITYIYGELNVTERAIEITTGSSSKVYDGVALENINATVTGGSLVSGHVLNVNRTTKLNSVGTVENELGIEITNAGGTVKTNNYAITFVCGNLTITSNTVTIKPKDATKVYDGTPFTSTEAEVLLGTMPSYHRIELTTSGTITDVGTEDNLILTINIFDNHGNDVTDNYTINFEVGELEVTPCVLKIKPKDEEKPYDGTMLVGNTAEVVVGELPQGFNVQITTDGTQIELGTNYENGILTATFFNANGEEVSSTNFDVSFDFGSLTITRRTLEIQSGSASKPYDGTPLTSTECEVIGGDGLLEGDVIEVLTSTSATDYAENGTENVITVRIMNGETDKTNYYSVEFTNGIITITQRNIFIRTGSDEKEYDGTPLTNEEYEIIGELDLVEGHTFSVKQYFEVVNAGVYANETQFKVMNGTIDVTANYNVDLTCGTLTITPRAITLAIGSDSFVYDGEAHYCEELIIGGKGLIAGHTYSVDQSSLTTLTNVGSIDNTFSIIINNGAENVTANYEITTTKGLLTVTPRIVTIKPQDAEKVYDGTPLISTRCESVSETQIVSGQTVYMETDGSQTNVGLCENAIINAVVYSGTVDVTANYTLTFEVGTLEVTPRILTIKPQDAKKPYDGTPLISNVCEEVSGVGIAPNEICEITTSGSQTAVGVNSANAILTYKITNAQNVDTTANYTITTEVGTLTVSLRSVEITTEDGSKSFDGEPLFNKNYQITGGDGLLGDDTLTITSFTEITEIGSVDNVLTFAGKNALGETVSYYDFVVTSGTLSVNKRSIQISSASDAKTYDGTPLYNEGYEIVGGDGLLNGHTIEVVSHTLATNYVLNGTPNELTFAVLNGTSDVSGYYDIEIVSIGSLVINKREITITSGSASKMYDGTILSETSFTVGGLGLVSGETADVRTSTKVVNFGDYENVIKIIIYKDGDITTANYSIDYSVKGTLSITKRPVTLKLDEATNIYDGTPFTSNAYIDVSEEYGLVSGDSATITANGSQLSVGSSTNVAVSVTFKNSSESDITANYDATLQNGTLTVTKRIITVKPKDEIKPYDGTPLYATQCEETSGVGFAQNETAEIVCDGGQTLVGTNTAVSITSIIIKDALGNDTTANYEISFEDGTLTVRKRLIEITSATDSKTYDDTALTNENFEISSGDGLLSGDAIVVVSSASITDFVSGGIENVIAVQAKNAKGKVCDYYEFEYVYGTLTIEKRVVEVTTGGGQKIYDGTPLSNDFYDRTASYNLVSGHIMTLETALEVTEAGTYNNKLTFTVDYRGVDKTANYTFNCSGGSLIITPRPITVTVGSASKKYDGTALTSETFTLSGEYGLVTGHVASCENGTQTELINVGSVENEMALQVFAGTEDKTANYEFTYIKGLLTVTPRTITIKPLDAEKEYDGTALIENTAEVSGGDGLCENHTIVIVTNGSQTNVGVNENNMIVGSPIINDAIGNDVSANYIITTEKGTLTVTKRNVTIKPLDAEKEYDGTPLTSNEFDASLADFVSGEYAVITTSGVQTAVGNSSNSILTYAIYGADGGLVDENNYQVTLEDGTLTVIKRKITITTANGEWIYDGAEHYSESCVITSGSLLGNDKISVISHTSITNFVDGGIDNELTVQIVSAKNKVRDYYEITMISGNLKVNKRPITVETDSDSKIYDGAELTCETFVISGEYGLVSGHVASCVSSTVSSITSVGSLENVFEVSVSDGTNSVDNNYVISYRYGTLEVTPRPITITTDGGTNVYNGEAFGVYTFATSGTGIVEGQIVSCKEETATTITNVGSTDNIFEVEILDGVEDVTNNYQIAYVYGTIEITPKLISIKPQNAEKEYDGTPIYATTWQFVSDDYSLVEGHELTASYVGSQTEVGESASRIVENSVVIMNGVEDVTNNYQITVSSGNLKVTIRRLTLRVFDITRVYSGIEYSYGNTWFKRTGELFEGHTLTCVINASMTEAGTMTVEIESYQIKDAEGNVITDSDYYYVTLISGTFTISKRNITIASPTIEYVYDGNTVSSANSEDCYVSSGSVVEGQVVNYSERVNSAKDVGIIDNAIDPVTITYTDALGNVVDMTDNYNITYATGKINITKSTT